MKIICTLENASLKINGVEFEKHRFGVISKEDLSDEQVAAFTAIPGYKAVKDAAEVDEAPAKPAKK